MDDGYIFQTDKIFFKHEISEALSCNAYSMHTHNAWELIYFLDGDATHVIEDRKYKLKKGDLVLIRPLQYHFIQIDSPSRYERFDILFDPEKHGVEGTGLLPDGVEMVSLSENPVAGDIFEKCDFYRRQADGELFARVLPHLLSELFYSLPIFPLSSSKESSSLSPLISKALQYINENLCSAPDISEIARRLFVSESYLFRLFKNELHQTPKKYITEKRLLLAQKLIASGEKPTKVALGCGFADYTTFYRNYTVFFGYSPKDTPVNLF